MGGRSRKRRPWRRTAASWGAHWRMFRRQSGEAPGGDQGIPAAGNGLEERTAPASDAAEPLELPAMTRTRQVLEEGDTATADWLVHEAEQIKGAAEAERPEARAAAAATGEEAGGGGGSPREWCRPRLELRRGRSVRATSGRWWRRTTTRRPSEMPAGPAPPQIPSHRGRRRAKANRHSWLSPRAAGSPGPRGRGPRKGPKIARRKPAEACRRPALGGAGAFETGREALWPEGRTQGSPRPKVQKAEKLDVAYEDAAQP